MSYQCAACGEVINADLLVYVDHTEKHIVELLKHDHPEWVEKDGVCKKCLDYYRAEIHGSIFKDAPCALRIRKAKGFWGAVTGIFGRKK